ncbi:unnamed protein product, partial [Strongylus vulgaris]
MCEIEHFVDPSDKSFAKFKKLTAEKKLPEPKSVNVVEAVPNMAVLGKEFKKDAKRVQIALAQLPEDQVVALEKELQTSGSYNLVVDSDKFKLTSAMVNVKRATKM